MKWNRITVFEPNENGLRWHVSWNCVNCSKIATFLHEWSQWKFIEIQNNENSLELCLLILLNGRKFNNWLRIHEKCNFRLELWKTVITTKHRRHNFLETPVNYYFCCWRKAFVARGCWPPKKMQSSKRNDWQHSFHWAFNEIRSFRMYKKNLFINVLEFYLFIANSPKAVLELRRSTRKFIQANNMQILLLQFKCKREHGVLFGVRWWFPHLHFQFGNCL